MEIFVLVFWMLVVCDLGSSLRETNATVVAVGSGEEGVRYDSSESSRVTGDLRIAHCGATEFFYLTHTSEYGRRLIKEKLAQWTTAAKVDEDIHHQRADGVMASTVLDLMNWADEESADLNDLLGNWYRWAVFTSGQDGELVMQALAVVQQTGGTIYIHGMVSRRALLRDAVSVSGAGKALVASLLEHVHRQDPPMTLRILGFPSDEHSDQLYRRYGAKAHVFHSTSVFAGGSAFKTGNLRLDISARCLKFVQDTVLCENPSRADKGAIFWRLIPGSGRIRRNCAHTVPRSFYLKKVRRLLGDVRKVLHDTQSELSFRKTSADELPVFRK